MITQGATQAPFLTQIPDYKEGLGGIFPGGVHYYSMKENAVFNFFKKLFSFTGFDKLTTGGFGELLLKSVVITMGWLFLPFWIFSVFALYFYFVPFFRAGAFLSPFLMFILSAFVFPHNPLTGFFLGSIFFLILGMKELVFVEREAAYTMLLFLFAFIAFFETFKAFSRFEGGALWIWMLIGAGFFVLGRGFTRHASSASESMQGAVARRMNFGFACVSLFIWQGGAVLSFLPANFLYQTTLLFAGTALFIQLIIDHAKNELTVNRLLGYFSVFFVLVTVAITAIPFS